MSRDEYLQILRDNLSNMSDDDKDDVIRYYLEYFADAGADREEEVMEELGSPEVLAGRLSGTAASQGDKDSGTKSSAGGSDEGTGNFEAAGEVFNGGSPYAGGERFSRRRIGAGWIILLILLSPAILPLAIVTVVLAFVLVLLAGILAGAVFVVFGALVAAGVVSIVAGVAAMFKSVADGLLVAGFGFMAVGIGIFTFFLAKLCAGAVGSFFGFLGRKIRRR